MQVEVEGEPITLAQPLQEGLALVEMVLLLLPLELSEQLTLVGVVEAVVDHMVQQGQD